MRIRNRAGSMRRGVSDLERTDDAAQNTQSGSGRPGAGPGGYCECPSCGIQVEHQRGTPCFYMKCPKWGEERRRV